MWREGREEPEAYEADGRMEHVTRGGSGSGDTKEVETLQALRGLDLPFVVGSLTVPNGVVAAPMAGVTCSAFRRHLKSHGVGLLYTEMVSAQGILHGNRRTCEYVEFTEAERPIAVQLFAAEPDAVARATAWVLERASRPDIIDINMGCPARKVVKTGAGAALMGDIPRAVAMAAAAVRTAAAAGVPVTVKLRTGLVPGDGVARDLAPRLEAVGVAAVALHARAASEFYKGRADHRESAAVGGRLSVPLVVSGDIDSVEQAAIVRAQSGCTAVMVARGMLGNPWLVGDLLWAAEGRGRRQAVTPAEAVNDLLRLFAGARSHMGDARAVRWIRSHLGWYLRRWGVSAARVQGLRLVAEANRLQAELEAVRAGFMAP